MSEIIDYFKKKLTENKRDSIWGLILFLIAFWFLASFMTALKPAIMDLLPIWYQIPVCLLLFFGAGMSLIGIVGIIVVAFVWNVIASPEIHKGVAYGRIIDMYYDMDYIPPTFDSKGKQTGGGNWDTDYYVIIKFDDGTRTHFEVTEYRWRWEVYVEDDVQIDYYKKGVLPYHKITVLGP